MPKSIIWILFILPQIGFAQPASFNEGGFIQTEYMIELPVEIVRDKWIVKVEVGGIMRRFLVDTGAPLCVTKSLVDELNLEIKKKIPVRDVNGASDSLGIINFPSLFLDKAELKDVPAVVLNDNVFTECFQLDGFIGSNALRNSVIQFDHKKSMIRITNNAQNLSIQNSNPVAIVMDNQSGPYLTVSLSRKAKDRLLFDSGSDDFYSISTSKLKQFKRVKGFEVIMTSTGAGSIGLYGAATSNETHRVLIPQLNFLGTSFSNVLTETSTSRSRIGAAMLKYGVLTLDYKNKQSYFDPFQVPVEFAESHWEITMSYEDNKLVVGKIWSAELQKKISPGDHIIRINDSDTENPDFCFLLKNTLQNNPTAKLKIKTQQGDVIDVVIRKQSR